MLVHLVGPKKLHIVCFNVNAEIADSILAMVTDALAFFLVIAPLSMDGRSSIFITKPANTQERLQAFQTVVNSPAYKKESIKPTFKKCFDYSQDRKPYHSEYNEHKPYRPDFHERTSNHSVCNQTKFSNSDNHPLLSLTNQSLYQYVISVVLRGTSLQNVLKLTVNLRTLLK